MTSEGRAGVRAAAVAVVVLALITVALAAPVSAQERWNRGQNVQPVFEGWERNDDGSFTMVFGYLNRNYEEQPIIPVGPNNFFSPGAEDRGQPTHFYNRRQQFVLEVQVPADWGEKDLVWQVTHNGRTDYAYGHLWPVWEIDDGVRRLNRGTNTAQGFTDNQAPFISVEGSDTLEVTLPDTLEVVVVAGDDGVPPPNERLAERNFRRGPKSQAVVDVRKAAATGLAVTWLHWPGDYVLQAVVDDTVYTIPVNVSVTVHPAASAP